MIDIDALERLAKAATPGEWQATDYTSEPAGGLGIAAPTNEVFVVNPAAIVRDQDARFIAAANPDVILAMIRELRAAREVIGEIPKGTGAFFDLKAILKKRKAYDAAIGGEGTK